MRIRRAGLSPQRKHLTSYLHQDAERAGAPLAHGAGAQAEELLNTRVQGTAADIVKRALTLLHERLEGSGAQTVCCVHDELLVEAPTAWARKPLRR